MATIAVYQIAEAKRTSTVRQSTLHGDVRGYAQVRDELQRSQARQVAAAARLRQDQERKRTVVAAERRRAAAASLQEQEVTILLQGFTAIRDVFVTIAWTGAVTMGFAAFLFLRQRVGNVRREFRFAFWTLGMLSVVFLTHAVFVSFVAICDGTKLCFQGTHHEVDVRRAVQGMMSLRSHVFWHFMAGFVAFLLLIAFTPWVKMEQDLAGEPDFVDGNVSKLCYGGILSGLAWCVPIARMAYSFRKVRRSFRDTNKSAMVHALKTGDLLSPDFVLAVVPQSVRRRVQGRGEKTESPSSPRSLSPSSAASSLSLSQAAAALQPERLSLSVAHSPRRPVTPGFSPPPTPGGMSPVRRRPFPAPPFTPNVTPAHRRCC